MAIICIAAQVYEEQTIYFLLNVEEKSFGQQIMIHICYVFIAVLKAGKFQQTLWWHSRCH